MRFCAAVILYNPDRDVFVRLSVYSRQFDMVLVIDNSADSNENKVLQLGGDNIVYNYLRGNHGMSRALELAFHYSRKSGFDFLVTMDQDSSFSEKSIAILKKCALQNSTEIGAYCVNYAKVYRNTGTGERTIGKYHLSRNINKFVDNCMTSGTFYNINLIGNKVCFDNFFIGFVDDDIARQIIKNGYKILMVGAAKLEQEVGNMVEDTRFNRIFQIVHHSPTRYYYMIRNVCYLKKKDTRDYRYMIHCYLKILRIAINIILGEKKKRNIFRACRLGYEDYKRGIYGPIPQNYKKELDFYD